MIKRKPLLLVSILLFSIFIVFQGCESGCQRNQKLSDNLLSQVEEYKLDNGMLWLLINRPGAAVFAGAVQVKVGGIEEDAGKAGIAHMFEHLAFKGSAEIGTSDFKSEQKIINKIMETDEKIAQARLSNKSDLIANLLKERAIFESEQQKYIINNEVWQLLHTSGAAELNAYTSKDVTNYHAKMPSNALGLWLYVTSEMVNHPVMREFYAERNVVMEERRTSVDNNPQGKLYESLMNTAYVKSPYRISTIGPMEEISGLTIADAVSFHKQYYVPERMVGVIAGNYNIKDAKKYIDSFWGKLPAGSSKINNKNDKIFLEEPPQKEERTVEIEFDASPYLLIAYHKPNLPARADYVFDALQYIMCGGESARLVRQLEKIQKIARRVGCWSSAPGSRLDNLFVISAEPLDGHTTEEVVKSIEIELARIRDELVSLEEMDTARTNLRASFLWSLNDNQSLAEHLAYFQTVAGDWRYAAKHSEVMSSITREELRQVAIDFLQINQRTVAKLRRKK